MSSEKLSFIIRVITGILILLSVSIIFYSKMIVHDYEIIQNEDGPDLEA